MAGPFPSTPLPGPARLVLWLVGTLVTGAAVPSTPPTPAPHWAFTTFVRPAGGSSSEPGSIDEFVVARLDAKGLAPAPPAAAHAWLRRVTLDLTGLPPTPSEVAEFTASLPDPRARERVVDRLLASPRYGERWAMHWLDIVRYADTHGFEVNTERPNAWPYRDYVIRSFNEDLPYDRFIREQIVGDALGADAATGFLLTASVLLPGQIGKDEPSIRLARQDALDEIVVNIGQTFLGLSIGCARCHDHKTDPVTQRDYYAMQAFVAGVEYEDRELHTAEAEARKAEAVPLRARVAEIDRRLAQLEPFARIDPPRSNAPPRRPTVSPRGNSDRFAPSLARRLRFTIRATNSLEPCLDELEVFDVSGTNVARASHGTRATTSGDTIVPDRHEPRFVHDGRYGNSRSWMSNQPGRGWVLLEFPRAEEVTRVLWSRDRENQYEDRLPTDYRIEIAGDDGIWRLVADASDRRPWVAGTDNSPVLYSEGLAPEAAAEVRHLVAEKQTLAARIQTAETGQLAFAGKFRAPDLIRVLRRGDPEQPGDEVAPAIPAALGTRRLASDTPEQERRRALADWIASPDHPLTARVMVNRIWQGHFGTGLVESSSDFGPNGAPPSHPELLDWLASEFVRGGWSIKRIHRLITLSATYGQSSAASAPGVAAGAGAHPDAESRLLWRFPGRRLEAETIRDAMLASAGILDLRMYGRGFDLFDQRGGLSGFKPVEAYSGEGLRRMIYAHKIRREREAVFGVFDCPDAGQSTPRRRESTTPIQALNLFNSRFTLDAAHALAARLRREAGDDLSRQIARAFLLTLARLPTAQEMDEARPVVRDHGLVALGRALFNSNEFLFLP